MKETTFEIQCLYDTYRSPILDRPKQNTGRRSDPVTSALIQIEAVRAKQEAAIKKWYELELELDKIQDIEIETIIRWRMLGASFEEIGKKVCATSGAIRKKLERYFDQQTHTHTYTHTQKRKGEK